MLLLSEHFSVYEFRCQCGRQACEAPTLPDPLLITKLESLRSRTGHPIRITSAIRCAYHNALTGGKPDSAHLTGHAADIACPDSVYRYLLIQHIYSDPVLFKRVGIGKDFIHLDTNARLDHDVCWTYYV